MKRPRRQIGDGSLGADVEARIAAIAARERIRLNAPPPPPEPTDSFGWRDHQTRQARAIEQHRPKDRHDES